VEHLGASMIAYGSALSNDSVYAQALVKLGETEEKIGKIQTDFVSIPNIC
jgi:hypothetical protein